MIHTIDGIISAACGSRTGVIAVAAAHDQPVIEAVVDARREGIATPILVGHKEEIASMLSALGEDPSGRRQRYRLRCQGRSPVRRGQGRLPDEGYSGNRRPDAGRIQ